MLIEILIAVHLKHFCFQASADFKPMPHDLVHAIPWHMMTYDVYGMASLVNVVIPKPLSHPLLVVNKKSLLKGKTQYN
jgi:hypothetical protein